MIQDPKCLERKCKYYLGIKQDEGIEDNERPHCSAFPDSIPDRIAYGENLHLIPLEDQQNEIVFGEA